MKRSKFSLSNYKVFSCDMGELVPCGLLEVLPGDTIQQRTGMLMRFSPMIAPVMHPVHYHVHHWFVPNRLIWDDFEDFITGGPDGDDASVYPTINTPPSTGFVSGSLGDYLGVPTGVPDVAVSALPFRAYALIYNEWYRDQDLVTPLTIDTTSGADTTTNTAVQIRAWERDYFTTSRPWEQKGTAVTVPIGTTAPIKGLGVAASDTDTAGGSRKDTATGTRSWTHEFADATKNIVLEADGSDNPQVFADLSQATGVDINDLREAFGLQRYQEARARYGSRYTEYLRYLQVRSSDARLQRPEYLGGGRSTIQMSEVLQTAEGASANNPVGDLKGHGIGALRTNRYRKYFEEHGWILSFVSTRPKAIYADGLFRHWNRRTKEDFWQKELQHIGQQEIENKEVYMAHSTPEGTFGFQDRYDEYRYQCSHIAGEFRDSTLDFWHFARRFASDPALNQTFTDCVPPKTPFAVPSKDTLWCMANHSIQARRHVARVGKSFIY